MALRDEALGYHQQPRPGKIEVTPTKPCMTQQDLSLAYTPGVAVPCREIEADPQAAYRYTAKGNLVAVISNGTAVLGLGDIGALAGKPVMEGKGVLFKRFADIDVFDLEVDTKDPDEFINIVAKLAPSFGGINLEDIKAPECFRIEQELIERLDIPVFHDDQHGTAIISGAALLNAAELADKQLGDLRMTVVGAGAAAVACARFYIALGVPPEQILMVDRAGVIYKGRTENMNPAKEEWAVQTDARTLADAMHGCDVLIGLSGPGLVTQEMIADMGERPIVMAMANPDPEILPEDVRAVRPEAIICTGRSDYPNQVNNVLGFPFIFRGALDVRARKINEEMKMAAARALADLARENVPETVLKAYGLDRLNFGPDYIIPKPLDPRVLLRVAPAVAQAAVDSGVARIDAPSRAQHIDALAGRLSRALAFSRRLTHRAAGTKKRIVFTEGVCRRVLRACETLREENVCCPVVLGRPDQVQHLAADIGVSLQGIEVLDWQDLHYHKELVERLYEKRQRHGMTREEAQYICRRDVEYVGALMVELGYADGVVNGMTRRHADALRPLLDVIDLREDARTVGGMTIVLTRQDTYFFADTTVNRHPSAEALAEIAVSAARAARRFGVTPRVAMLSYSNFGSAEDAHTRQLTAAIAQARQKDPELLIDGEMLPETAVCADVLEQFPFNTLGKPANVLVFPDLDAGAIATNLLRRLGGAEVLGPVTLGFAKPVGVVDCTSDVPNLIATAAMTAIAAAEGTF